MADGSTFDEKRRHPRLEIAKSVRATVGDREISGTSQDISGGGVALGLDEDFDLDDDEYLQIDIEDVGEMSGQVIRSFDDGIGVRFVDIDDQEEEMLMAELESLSDSLDDDDF